MENPPDAIEVNPFEMNVTEFISSRVATLRMLARRAWKVGDRYFLVRQHEHFMFAHDSCLCEAHKCTGCLVSSSIASQLESDIGKGTEEARSEVEREKARVLIRLEAEDTQFQIQQISQRVRNQQNAAINARDNARQAREEFRRRSLRQDKNRDVPPNERGER